MEIRCGKKMRMGDPVQQDDSFVPCNKCGSFLGAFIATDFQRYVTAGTDLTTSCVAWTLNEDVPHSEPSAGTSHGF